MNDTGIDTARRSFFSTLARKTVDFTVRVADAQAIEQGTNWMRPPFALDELQFLLACTRCGACKGACPQGTITILADRRGLKVAGTPVLDLLNKACHLCAGWPCVAACEPEALKLPLREEPPEGAPEVESPPPLPRLADVRIDTQTCLPHTGPGCGACAHICPVPGALVWNQCKPYIVPQLCIGCALCREACIVEPKAILVQSRHKAVTEQSSLIEIAG